MYKGIREFISTKKTVSEIIQLAQRQYLPKKKFPILKGIEKGSAFSNLMKHEVSSLKAEVERKSNGKVLVDSASMYEDIEFHVSLAAERIMKASGHTGISDLETKTLFAGITSSLMPYFRYGERQGEYKHFAVSKDKMKELDTLDVGDFTNIPVRELVNIIEEPMVIFYEDMYALIIVPSTGHRFYLSGSDRGAHKLLRLSIIPLRGVELFDTSKLPQAIKEIDGRHKFSYLSGTFVTLADIIHVLYEEDGTITMTEDKHNTVSQYFTGEVADAGARDSQNRRILYKDMMSGVVPLLMSTLLYIKSKNVKLSSRPASDRASEIVDKIKTTNNPKQLKNKLSAMGNILWVTDLDSAVVTAPPARKSKSGSGSPKGMHVRRGHLHKVLYGSRSIPKEDRPYHIYYYPQMIVGTVENNNIHVKKV